MATSAIPWKDIIRLATDSAVKALAKWHRDAERVAKHLTLHHYVYDNDASVGIFVDEGLETEDEIGALGGGAWSKIKRGLDRQLEAAADRMVDAEPSDADFTALVAHWQLALADAADRIAKTPIGKRAAAGKVRVVDEYGVRLEAKDRARLARELTAKPKPAKAAKAAKAAKPAKAKGPKGPPRAAGVPEDAVWATQDTPWLDDPNEHAWEHGALDADGKRTGTWNAYRAGGKKLWTSEYKKGVLDGAFTRWHLDGTPSAHGENRKGSTSIATYVRTKAPTDERFPDGDNVWSIVYKYGAGGACTVKRFLADGRSCDMEGVPGKR